MRKADENPTPAQDPSSTPNRLAIQKRVATCPYRGWVGTSRLIYLAVVDPTATCAF